ncbi:UNVERIFIED_CONTAM: hypothetical protein NY100_24755, partial [Prevotella sp. 15_C9]
MLKKIFVAACAAVVAHALLESAQAAPDKHGAATAAAPAPTTAAPAKPTTAAAPATDDKSAGFAVDG